MDDHVERNIFGDTFTGRVLESLKHHKDEEGVYCYQLTFLGTNRKLRIYSADLSVGTKIHTWVDDDKTHTL